MGENNRRIRKNEKMFFSYPPKVESLAVPSAELPDQY